MEQDEPETHLSKTEARAGVTPHVTRYVLGISGVLVIILFIAVVFFGR